MTLKNAVEGREYLIQNIVTDDEELNAFSANSLIMLGNTGSKNTFQTYRKDITNVLKIKTHY